MSASFLYCNCCNYKSSSSISNPAYRLFMHYLYNHADLLAEDKMICDECAYQTVTRDNLKEHIQNKHNDQPKQILACDDCSKCYSKMNSLAAHIESAHLRDAYDCEQCGGRFDSKIQLKKHEHDRHGNKLHCDNCPYWCRRKSILNRHIRTKHK